MNDQSLFCRLNYLAVINVTGNDSATFLQGQLSCNIRELDLDHASIGAYCTAKGRVISTLLVVPYAEGFRLLLPADLQATVLKSLQRYVLRAAVKLSSDFIIPCGIQTPLTHLAGMSLPTHSLAIACNDSRYYIRLPSGLPRYWLLNNAEDKVDDFRSVGQDVWRFEDMADGIPWFAAGQTEVYTPHMLGLDRLGGISLNKGCYTGQEIIARTHYLGKNKRTLLAAFAPTTQVISDGQAIIDRSNQQIVGHVLASQMLGQQTRLLMVMNTDPGDSVLLSLTDAAATPLTLLPFQGVPA